MGPCEEQASSPDSRVGSVGWWRGQTREGLRRRDDIHPRSNLILLTTTQPDVHDGMDNDICSGTPCNLRFATTWRGRSVRVNATQW